MKIHNEVVHSFYVNIGANIKYYRQIKNIIQDDLAFSLGISRVSLVNIESGKQRLPLHLMADVAKLLDMSVDTFIAPSNLELSTNKEQVRLKRKIENLEAKIKALKG